MTNLETDVVSVGGLQLVDENIVIQYEDSAYEQHYVLLNAETGAVLVNANTMG